MARAGQIILLHFPQTNLQEGKLRPALIISLYMIKTSLG